MRFEVKEAWRATGLLLLLVAVSVALRLPGFDGRALWVDELWRVNLILEKGSISRYWSAPDLYTAITAPLYLAFNSLLGWIDTSPWCLRLSSFLPGLISVALAFSIARKAGAGLGWATAATALFAANEKFIQYSNEFKPYMFEVMSHLACMALWLDLVTPRPSRQRQWVMFTLALLVAAFCTANIVFVLPAMALSLADKVLTQERDKLKPLFASFFIVGCAVIGLYFLVWSYGSDKGLISYWADNFHDATREGYLNFAGKQLLGMWKAAFSTVGAGRGMFVLSALGLIGALYACGKRRLLAVQPVRGLLIYGLVLTLTVLALNRVGLWPIGEIRPNLFLFAIIAAWWVILLSIALTTRAQWLMAALLIAAMVTGVAKTSRADYTGLGPPLEQSDRVWAAFAASTPAGKAIVDQCKEKKPVTVFVNPAMSHAFRYYAQINDSTAKTSVLSSQCAAIKFVPDAYMSADSLRKQILAEQPSAGLQWYVFSHLNEEEIGKLKSLAQEFGTLQSEEIFEGAGYFSVKGDKTAN